MRDGVRGEKGRRERSRGLFFESLIAPRAISGGRDEQEQSLGKTT